MPSALPLCVALAGESVAVSGVVELPVAPLFGGGEPESIAPGLVCEVAGVGGGTLSFLLQPLSIRPATAMANKLRCIISVSFHR